MPRPKGSLNKATREIREVSRRLLADKEYQASLRRRLIDGDAPHMETLLHHYAWGKPKDTTVVEGEDGESPTVTVVHQYIP
jgi:hypothetical protein